MGGKNGKVRTWCCVTCGASRTTVGSGRNGRYCSTKCRDRHLYKPKTTRTNSFNKRAFILESKIARGNCMDCGYEMSVRTARAFDWDHRDPHTKSFELSNPPAGATMHELLEEMAKCDVICRNCHALRPTSHLGRLIKTPQRQLSLGGIFDL